MNFYSSVKYIILVLFIQGFCISGVYAAASCNVVSEMNLALPAEITSSPGSAIGAPIDGVWYQVPAAEVITCTGDSYNASEELLLSSTVMTYYEGGYSIPVLATSNPSVGIAVLATGWVQSPAEWPFPYNGQWKPNNPYANYNSFKFGFRLKFIKLGYIEPGPITGDTIGLFYIHDHMNPGSMRYGSVGLNYIGTTILSSGTCTPTLTNQSVAMDIATFDSLANVGDVAGTTPFEIDMFCDGNPNVAIRFDGIADPNVVDNTVLLSTGTSDGVGLQITHDGDPMTLGENVEVLTNAPDGNVSLPFEVSYFRVSRDLYAGSVNSVATFTISYP